MEEVVVLMGTKREENFFDITKRENEKDHQNFL